MHTDNHKVSLYRKQTVIFIAVGLFISLYLHDNNLYPHLSATNTAVLSFLRFILLVTPIILGFLIVKFKENISLKFLLLIVWVLFLPYTIYSVTEIRHVAEMCRLPKTGVYYTNVCSAKLWTLFPTLIYAVAGSLGFVFTVSQVTSHLFSVSRKKQLAIIILCIVSGFASVFGLYTRINIWEVLKNPIATLHTFSDIICQKDFLLNFIIFSLFTTGLFFAINRIFRQADKYIK